MTQLRYRSLTVININAVSLIGEKLLAIVIQNNYEYSSEKRKFFEQTSYRFYILM